MIKDYLDEKLHEECGVFGVTAATRTWTWWVATITACTRCSTAARRAAAWR